MWLLAPSIYPSFENSLVLSPATLFQLAVCSEASEGWMYLAITRSSVTRSRGCIGGGVTLRGYAVILKSNLSLRPTHALEAVIS